VYVNHQATLTGRNLEPWRPLLAVAKWLNDQGVTGLWKRMEALSQGYQAERQDLEPGDLTTLVIQQVLRSLRRNALPVELIDRPFLMRQEHLAGALVERSEITKTASRSNGVLHHPPEAFDGIEMVTTMGR
jgi:hypothetical protein